MYLCKHPSTEPTSLQVELTNTIKLYGLIFLGSTTAFSAMVSAAIIFLQTSCVIPQAILLYRGRDKVLPIRYFSLGKFGWIVNVTAVTWVVFLDIIYCFPTVRPVTSVNLNYVSVVCAGLVMFVIGLWFTCKRGKFTEPKINMEELIERRMAALNGEVTHGIGGDAESLETSMVMKK
jgi:choline transport protein